MRILICWMIVSEFFAIGQKLETQTLDPKKVIRVETAKDHLTVIELGEPVTMVAVGNQSAFSIERRENKVFVKPTEEDAETNLFIWTTAGRFAYELVPAPGVEKMDFAIDQAPIPPVAKVMPEAARPPKPAPMPADMLTKGKPILLQGDRETAGRVEIALRDLYREGNRLYVRYAVINHSARDYTPTRPAALRLIGVHSPLSLVPFPNHQLSERLARSIKADGEMLLDVVDANQIAQVVAGGQGFGWLVVEDPAIPQISVLRLEFASDERGPVDAVLVLEPGNDHKEAANVRPGVE
jgi:Conjugal transfer protein